MFGFFLAAAPTNFLLIFLSPLAIYSRWVSLPLSIFAFLASLCASAATIIATAMFLVFKIVITSQTELNIRASIGIQMFVFMWLATLASLVGAWIQFGMCCCCASRKDVETGRRKGSKRAYEGEREKSSSDGRRCCGMLKGKTEIA